METEPGEADDPRSREHRTPLFSHADSSMRESDPVEAKNKVNPSSVKEIRKSYKDIVSANQGKEIEFDTLMEDSTSDEEEGEDSMDIPVHQCDEVDDNPLKPAISLSPNLLRKIRKKWENTLIVKLLGKSIGFRALSTRLRAMWNLQGEFEIIDLDGGFFLLKFDYIQDYHYVTNGGPWIILNHYLTVRKWEANFKPSEALETKTAVWLRLPELPIEYYDEKGPKALVVPGLVLTNAKTHPSPDLIPSRPIRSQDKPYNPTVEEDATNPNMITIPSHLPIAATPFISPSAFTPSICLEPKSPSSPPSQNFNPNSATSLTACLEPIRSVSPPTVANQLDLMETPCFQDNPDVPLDPDIPSFSTSVSMVAGTSRQPSPTQRYRSFSPDARRGLGHIEETQRLSCPPQQHASQQLRQPRHAKAPPQSWASAIAHWSFIREQVRMQHMQQQWPHSLPQKLEAALTKISAASGSFGSLDPGGVFSAVAIKLPKPTPRFCSTVTSGIYHLPPDSQST
ncbi:LOW QUALITY PROTEIN: hypothetical protein RJ640_002886 [Escallonia rubra]|uniref:DUF4283 domain-containing protein n=1 Tax=Escallonia rubra TaxID=112253 RepID=A0AA88RV08_9ASTE|nr:LOW QUALITY PROTEIN: hypothetical protein RJ640_002886 [Escallonia rubra]